MLLTLTQEEIEAACFYWLLNIKNFQFDSNTFVFREDSGESIEDITLEVEINPDDDENDE